MNGLSHLSNSSFQNEAGFVFDVGHLTKDGGYYKQQQQEIVAGFDGSYRLSQFLTIAYVGMYPAYQLVFLKFLLDKIGVLKNAYYSNWFVRL